MGGAAPPGTSGSEKLGGAGWEEESEKQKCQEGTLRKGESGWVGEGEPAPGTSPWDPLTRAGEGWLPGSGSRDSHFWKPLCPGPVSPSPLSWQLCARLQVHLWSVWSPQGCPGGGRVVPRILRTHCWVRRVLPGWRGGADILTDLRMRVPETGLA